MPILTSQRFEADDVIGTLAMKAQAAGFDVAIVTGDKDFFQLVGDGITVYNPRDDGTWYDRDGVKEKFGVLPSQVVDVLALMGDSIDNIKGVPGVGEKGARDLDREVRLARGTAGARLRSLEQAVSRRPADVRRRCPSEPRARADQDRRPGDVRPGIRPVPRRATRDKCFELFARLGFRSLVMEYAPTAETVGKQYSVVATPDAVETLVARLRQSGRFGFRVMPDSPTAMRAGISGVVFSTVDAHGRLRARRERTIRGRTVRRRRRDRTAWPRSEGAAGGRQTVAGGPNHPESRARPEVRHDRARAPRRHTAGPRDRHDDRELPARRDPVWHIRSRSSRSSTPATRRCARKTSAAAA